MLAAGLTQPHGLAVDQDGTVFNMPVFGDVKGIDGHTAKATLEKNQRVKDCIVFELPEEAKSSKFFMVEEGAVAGKHTFAGSEANSIAPVQYSIL